MDTRTVGVSLTGVELSLKLNFASIDITWYSTVAAKGLISAYVACFSLSLQDFQDGSSSPSAQAIPKGSGPPELVTASNPAATLEEEPTRLKSAPEEKALLKSTATTPAQPVLPENLRIYRELVGITTSSELTDTNERSSPRSYLWFKKDPDRNVGYYHRIVNDELEASIWYTTATWAINILLALQIGIAATLTALGVAGKKPTGVVITVLAAVNTAIATALTYLKAKGQPTRALLYRDALRKLKEHVEYTERLFEFGITFNGSLDPARAAEYVKNQYDAALRQQERTEQTSQSGQMGAHPAANLGHSGDRKINHHMNDSDASPTTSEAKANATKSQPLKASVLSHL